MSPRPTDDPKTERLFVRVQPKLKSELEGQAEIENQTVSEIIIKAIKNYLNSDEEIPQE
jgi:hypothetical protein